MVTFWYLTSIFNDQIPRDHHSNKLEGKVNTFPPTLQMYILMQDFLKNSINLKILLLLAHIKVHSQYAEATLKKKDFPFCFPKIINFIKS